MRAAATTPWIISSIAGAAGAGIVLTQAAGWTSIRSGFLLLTVVLCTYLWVQAMHLKAVHPQRWLLNPVVLCSGLTFFLGFGLGNALFLLPPGKIALLGLVPDITPAMLKMMALALLAAVAMWQGYWSAIASALSGAKYRRSFERLLKKSNRTHPWAVPGLLAVSTLARLALIRLGLFGYSSSYDALVAAGSYTQYLVLLASLGKLALVLASLQHYMSGRRSRRLLIAAVAIEIMFGLLSGFKSQVVLPFVVVGLCQYLATNRLPTIWILVVFIGVFVAYQVIEPFRALRNQEQDYRGTSVSTIGSALFAATSGQTQVAAQAEESAPVALAFLARSSLVYIGSLGIEFLDSGGQLPKDSPHFVTDIFLAPAYAWIPRVLWTSKPVGDIGFWYTRTIMGLSESFSSTGMTPITYLYFAGGAIAIALGFFFIGIVQRIAFFLCQPARYLGGALVLFGILQTLVQLPDGFYDVIIVLLREVPLLVLVQSLLLRPRPRGRIAVPSREVVSAQIAGMR